MATPLLLAAPLADAPLGAASIADQAMEIILHNGVMGAVFLVVVIPLWRHSRSLEAELRKTQEQRTADAKAVIEKFLTLNDRWNTSVSELTGGIDLLIETMKEVRLAMSEIVSQHHLIQDMKVELTRIQNSIATVIESGSRRSE